MVLRGDICKFPRGFWKRPEAEQNAIEVSKYLIETILKWSDDDIKNKLNGDTFCNNKLGGMIKYLFNYSPYKILEVMYPDRFKIWELNVPKSYWTLETGIQTVKEFIEEKLKWSEEDVKKNLTSTTFIKNGLGGMFSIVFHSSTYEAINSTYPNKFKIWELKQVPAKYWSLKTGIIATRWLITDKLKLKKEDIKGNVSQKVFIENGLIKMLRDVFQNSYKIALRTAYPELKN